MKLKVSIFTALLVAGMQLMAQSKTETVKAVLEVTGFKDQLQSIDALMASKIEEKKSSFEKTEDFERFKTMMTTGMNSKNMLSYFEEYLTKNTVEDSLKMVITLFSDPFVKEFSKLEKEASLPEKKQEMTTYFQSFSTNPPAQSRVQQLIALDKELKATEMTYKIFQNLIFSMIKGGNAILPKEKQMTEDQMKDALAKALPANFNQMLMNQSLAMSLFTYKSVSDEKLNKYLEIYKTKPGRYCMSKYMEAFDYSFTKMGSAIGNSLIQMEKK